MALFSSSLIGIHINSRSARSQSFVLSLSKTAVDFAMGPLFHYLAERVTFCSGLLPGLIDHDVNGGLGHERGPAPELQRGRVAANAGAKNHRRSVMARLVIVRVLHTQRGDGDK